MLSDMPDIFIDIFTVLVLLGVGQALFLIMLLLSFRQKDALPNFLLSFLLFDFSIGLLGTTLGTSGYYEKWPHLIRLAEPLVFIYGPVIFLYVRSLTGKKIGSRELLHFLPFVLTVLLLIPFYLKSGDEKIAFVKTYFLSNQLMTEAFAMISLRMAHLLIYIFLSFRLLKAYEKGIRDQFSNVDKLSLSWLYKLLIGFAAIIFVSFITYVLVMMGKLSLLDSNIIASLMVAVVIYSIGYLGFRQTKLRLQMEQENGQTEPLPKESEQARSHAFSEEMANRYLLALQQKMEQEKLFTRSELSLNMLAGQLGIQPYQLSQLINRELNQTFFDFVNQYRIEEVKGRLVDPANKPYTIMAIAMDAGFNSKSAFNQAFKKYTGLTPSAYRKHSQGNESLLSPADPSA